MAVTRQRLTLVGGYPGGVWTCSACRAELENGTIDHRDDCGFIAGIREQFHAEVSEQFQQVLADNRAAERQRAIRLATEHGAYFLAEPRPCTCKQNCGCVTRERLPFADLLREQP